MKLDNVNIYLYYATQVNTCFLIKFSIAFLYLKSGNQLIDIPLVVFINKNLSVIDYYSVSYSYSLHVK